MRKREGPLEKSQKLTAKKILSAATIEFARWGYGGARIDRISARAGTNVRSIYYHFSSKRKLFQTVLEHAYARLIAEEVALQTDQLDPIEGMVALSVFTWNYFVKNPELLSLLHTENIHRAEHMKHSTIATEISGKQLGIIADLLRRGVAEGKIRPNIDPTHVFLTISALASFYLSNRYTLSVYLGKELMDSDELARWLHHLRTVVVAMLKN